jgi:hypothetical protein
MKTKNVLIAILIVFLIGYFLFEARFLILGPQITIDSPRDGEVVNDRVVTITGRAQNAAWVSLNGRQIFTDEEGHWSEKLIVSEGLSIMTVSVRDRFGRTREETVRIILN